MDGPSAWQEGRLPSLLQVPDLTHRSTQVARLYVDLGQETAYLFFFLLPRCKLAFTSPPVLLHVYTKQTKKKKNDFVPDLYLAATLPFS
jgi:hypothetical protein